MQFSTINARIELIRDNEEETNRFVEEYKPFIASCAEKVTGRFMDYGIDDELSIAMMAFMDAIRAFDETKGNFFSFSRRVIKRRLIDYYRSEQRHNKTISLNMYMENMDEEVDLSSSEALRLYSEQDLANQRKWEMEELARELSDWNITFADLVKVSPKFKKTRNQCRQLVEIILSRPDLLQTVLVKRYLPVAELEKASGLHRKMIERYRKYIIALVIIITGDYEYIRDYIKL